MVKSYDPKEVSIIIAGNITTGFADGTYLVVERNNPSWNLSIGSDGEGVRAKSNDKSGRFVITLQQGSPMNDILSGLYQADELGSGGVFSVLVKDNNGSSLHAAATAWVIQPASAEYAREIGSREWTIETDSLEHFVGGNFTAEL
jgi:hypothetical protein